MISSWSFILQLLGILRSFLRVKAAGTRRWPVFNFNLLRRFQNEWNYTSTTPRFIMASCLITDWKTFITLLRITNDGWARHTGHSELSPDKGFCNWRYPPTGEWGVISSLMRKGWGCIVPPSSISGPSEPWKSVCNGDKHTTALIHTETETNPPT